MSQSLTTEALSFTKPFGIAEKEILNHDVESFLTDLVSQFSERRDTLLSEREIWKQKVDNGMLPDFISESDSIINSEWKVNPIPKDLQDRRVEITGPVDRKMVINALNANVKVFMADFEDSLAPTWDKVIDGQINLRDAVKGTISYTNEQGKCYQLKASPAVLIARVRGLHLPEKHVLWQGKPIPGCLFDFALYFYHNYKA